MDLERMWRQKNKEKKQKKTRTVEFQETNENLFPSPTAAATAGFSLICATAGGFRPCTLAVFTHICS